MIHSEYKQELKKYRKQILIELKEFVGEKKHENIDKAFKAIEEANLDNFDNYSGEAEKQIEFYMNNPNLAKPLPMLTSFAKIELSKEAV